MAWRSNLDAILDGSRTSARRRESLAALVATIEAEADRGWDAARAAQAAASRERQTVADLKAHLRDRDRHIRNLESEVRDRMGVGA